MSDRMRVDTATLAAAVPSFAAVASVLDQTLRRASDRLDAQGRCWGTDDLGATFGRSYEPAAAAVREALASLAASVDQVGRSVRAAADNVDGAEGRAQGWLG